MGFFFIFGWTIPLIYTANKHKMNENIAGREKIFESAFLSSFLSGADSNERHCVIEKTTLED